jgi:hypothetical protein
MSRGNYRPADTDVFWLISLAWLETDEPYPGNPDHRPLLHFGRTMRFETFHEAESAANRMRENTSWAPRHAHEPTVSNPSFVYRRKAS